MKYIITQDEKINIKENDLIKLVGGKGIGLIKISQILPNIVPYYKIITTKVFEEFIKPEIQTIIDIKENSSVKAQKIIERIKETFYNKQKLIEILKQAYITNKNLAIRSSGISEDSLEKSFAGQMETFLNVNSYESYLNSVLKCFCSIFTPRAINYKIQNNKDPFNDSIAVIVQEMIDADTSGVIFTFDPANNTDNIVINSVFGLGEGLVSGKLNSDHYIISKQTKKIINTTIANKDKTVVLNTQGVKIKDEPNPTKSSLNEKQISDLVEISLKIEKIYQKPVDIEFCIKKNNIYILQVRYITTIKLGNYRIWDNSNIVESYPGITTPLTFSFIRIAYSSVYKQFCEIMSVDKQTILQNRYLFDSMLGFIHNRVYYNLLNWYELLMLLPGFNNNKEFMEQMMGVKQKLTKPLTPKKYNPINLLIVSIKMIINFVFLNSKIKKFLNEFNNVYDNYLKIKKSNKLSNMETHELFEIYKELEEKILFNWKAPILNDLYVMIFFGLLKKLNKKWKLPENIHTKLLSQTGEIKTTIFMEELIKITKKIRETNLDQFFIQSTTENLLQHYNNYKNENNDNPELNMIFQEIENYINLYGSRVIGELKLETKTLEENPTYLFTLIKNYLSNYSNIGNKNTDNTEEDIKTFGKQLKGIKYFIYKWVLTKAKETMKNREDQRFARSLAYSIVRDIVKTIANNWMKKGIIENKDDIFFLEWNEIWDYTFGKSSLHNIINLIKVRKQEFENSKNIELPDRFETYNEVYYNLNFSKFEEEKEALKGITACPGKTKGKVKIVKDIDEIENLLKTLNGEILVAKYTDPGWTLLFPSISGLIIEKGSVLSHTAIVAREMGIPTIVGVKNATSILKDENIVELNATNGTITIIN